MALILYECPADFPSKIASVLGADGLGVSITTKRAAPVRPGPKDFSYTISDGISELLLSGGEEPDGRVGFFVAVPWSWRPKVVRARRALYARVSRVLAGAGARIWG